jgi:hypothetical protein
MKCSKGCTSVRKREDRRRRVSFGGIVSRICIWYCERLFEIVALSGGLLG